MAKLAEEIRRHVLVKYIEPARRRGEQRVQVVAGDVVREMRLQGRVPAICSALKKNDFLKTNNLVLEKQEGPERMQSTTVKYTYLLMKGQSLANKKRPGGTTSGRSLLELWGIGREVFRSLGGADAFMKKEREAFYGDEKRS